MKPWILLPSLAALSVAANLALGEQAVHSGLATVERLDRAASEVTLKHEPIASLDWPAMTMAFEVKDGRLLDRLQLGKRVAFEFLADGSRHVVTSVIPLGEPQSAAGTEQHAPPAGMGMMMGSMHDMMDKCMGMMKEPPVKR